MQVVLAERFEGCQPRVITVFTLGESRGRLHDGVPLRRRQSGSSAAVHLRTSGERLFVLISQSPNTAPHSGSYRVDRN